MLSIKMWTILFQPCMHFDGNIWQKLPNIYRENWKKVRIRNGGDWLTSFLSLVLHFRFWNHIITYKVSVWTKWLLLFFLFIICNENISDTHQSARRWTGTKHWFKNDISQECLSHRMQETFWGAIFNLSQRCHPISCILEEKLNHCFSEHLWSSGFNSFSKYKSSNSSWEMFYDSLVNGF